MITRPSTFKQADIDRLLMAAKKAGAHEVKVMVGLDAVIVPLKEPPPPVPEPEPRLAKLRLRRQPTVYFVGCDGHVKIGFTRDIKHRMGALATGHHRKLELLATIENASPDLEYELHNRFAAHHVRGEWFKITPEIQSFIDGLDATRREGKSC